jgi:hypothetical protein
MPQIDEPTSPAPKTAPEAKKSKPAAEKPVEGVYSFTIDTGSGRIVTVERVDGSGVRHSLSAEDRTRLAKLKPAMPLRHVVERAFEAGIEFVLGEGEGSETPESKEDGELSGVLLQTMIESSKAGELVKGDALHRSVIDTLIVHAAK